MLPLSSLLIPAAPAAIRLYELTGSTGPDTSSAVCRRRFRATMLLCSTRGLDRVMIPPPAPTPSPSESARFLATVRLVARGRPKSVMIPPPSRWLVLPEAVTFLSERIASE